MPLPPHYISTLDQQRARLADMVNLVREHKATCGIPDANACIGEELWPVLDEASRDWLQSMLNMALCELATLDALPTATQLDPAPVSYLLWSNKHSRWWRPQAFGYTDRLDEAGRYSEAEALRHVAKSAMHGDLSKVTCMVATPPEPPTTVEET